MRVLHTIDSLRSETGGPARSVPGLCGALVNTGARVSLWARDVQNGYIPPEGVTLITGDLATLAKTAAKHDIIHDHGLWLSVNHKISQLARSLSLPRIVSTRGMLEPWALNHKKWKKRLAWRLYQKRDLSNVACIHATSKAEADQINKIGVRRPLSVIPNGVDVPLLAERAKRDVGKKTLLFLSRIQKKKGLLNLVGAWKQVQNPDWRIRIVGPEEDGHLNEVRSAAEEAGVIDDFLFEGPVEGNRKWDVIRSADLFVLPTHSENFGIAIAEALACEVPVITTKGTPWQELETEACGWWVDIGIAPLAEGLREAFSLKDTERQSMGVRGRELVKRKYTWPSIAARMLATYKWVLNRSNKPGCVRF
ncbi:glycosyltransferase [Puniceicoccaceae bacterium K14]|nr:glycosyltransferase [Puniceicoccaceae bacterium K14]